MFCVGSNISLQGFKFSFVDRVVVFCVFAGSIVVGATIINFFYYLLLSLELKHLWLFFSFQMRAVARSSIAKKKEKEKKMCDQC
jgi:hypothetical protein